MRWKEPEKGDTRIRSWFALFPINLNGITRWLEWVTVEQEYTMHVQAGCIPVYSWDNKKFTDIEEDEK